MATFTNLKGERISSVKNKDGTTTKTILSTGNPVTATHSGSKDKDGNNTVDAYNKSIGYSASGKVKTGITTSKDAENRGKAANETLKGITTPSADVENPLTALYSRLDKLKADVATAKEKVAASKATKTADTTTATQTGATDTTTPATPEAADPILQFMQDSSTKYLDILGQQAQTLGQYREQHNEYTQQEIDSIARTAERAVKNQVAENQRTVDAIRFAGVVAGRAQFAPTVEQSIIHEVIQDGLDEIEVINEKKNSAIRAARQAESEFNIEAFEQQSELAKEYHKEVEGAFSRMNAHVRQVELDEREKTKFKQEQEERSSLILAEELIDATPEKIMQTAAANGIDVGLLTKAVNDARFEQTSRGLDIEGKRASIASANRANRPSSSSGPGVRLGNFNEADSATLLSNGLESASLADQRLFLQGGVDDRSAILKKYSAGHQTFEQYLDSVQNEANMSVDPSSSLYQSIKEQYEEDYSDEPKVSISSDEISSYLGDGVSEKDLAKANTLAQAMVSDGKSKTEILTEIAKITAR